MSTVAEARSLATLLRWLGPWAGPSAEPRGIRRRTVVLDPRHPQGSAYVAWLYEPATRPAHRSYLIAPGLHFRGPAEPRIQRFCSILAASGFAVLAPFLPDFVSLRITPRLIGDFERAFEWLYQWPSRPPGAPGVFSISFGSLPALRLAASPEYAERLSHVVCFGGYGNFPRALEFCLTGQVEGRTLGQRDPLNQPAAFLNLLDYMDRVPADRASLEDGWMRYLRATWGRPEMKADGAYQVVAERIARDLPLSVREMFRMGTGIDEGGIELCRPALSRMGERAAFVDPRPHLHGVKRPVTLVHGRDDDVIPFTQAVALASDFPDGADVRVLLTGLYDHSRPAGDSFGAKVRLLATEGANMIEILRVIGQGHRRHGG